jgi:hypothetical protein
LWIKTFRLAWARVDPDAGPVTGQVTVTANRRVGASKQTTDALNSTAHFKVKFKATRRDTWTLAGPYCGDATYAPADAALGKVAKSKRRGLNHRARR